MPPDTTRVISVRGGRVRPSGSWLYVWIDIHTDEIAYVGSTGFDPELRAHLHVDSDDPAIERVRAIVPRFDERDFDGLAFVLDPSMDRRAAKDALTARLSHADASPDLQHVIDPIVRAVRGRTRRT
jgi:hypothetical protein